MSSQPILALRKMLFTPRVPSRLSSRFRNPDRDRLRSIELLLRERHFAKRPPGFLETADGSFLLREQFVGRLDVDRAWFIPWIASVVPLVGLRVLEIGCGTGSSTVALAEQGARVTGLDFDADALAVAEERARAYEVDLELIQANATDSIRVLRERTFDFIIFYASLEHMVHEERIESMRETWRSLESGAHWCATDTPNRIWYRDLHTTRLPFFQWLPDDLALEYLDRSPRQWIRDLVSTSSANRMTDFLRLGRGVSYHEFEIAMAPVGELQLVSCKRMYFRNQNVFRRMKQEWSEAGRFERFLMRAIPEVPRPFLMPSLDVVLRKP